MRFLVFVSANVAKKRKPPLADKQEKLSLHSTRPVKAALSIIRSCESCDYS